MTKFVLIVPTLNSYKILSKLVNSLKNQSFDNWKIIFVDGNSSNEHKKWLRNEEKKDMRIKVLDQKLSSGGIFGAMSEGILEINSYDWILFWGSDDWASSKDIFYKIYKSIEEFKKYKLIPDLIICNGRYVNSKNKPIRSSNFSLLRTLRFSLFIGSTPAHQATIFRGKLLKKNFDYQKNYKLAADLDIFLRISKFYKLKIETLNITIVNISPDGISKKLVNTRIKEVIYAYNSAFGFLWPIPFLLRYLRKIFSLL